MKRKQKRRSRRKGGGWICLLILLALFAAGSGYLASRYVIYPYILGMEMESSHFFSVLEGLRQ